MKKFAVLLLILFTGISAFADVQCDKCSDIMSSMYYNRAALYNVLNLTPDQVKCKDVIDKKRYEALKEQSIQLEQEKYVLSKLTSGNASKNAVKKQQKVIKNIEKCMNQTGKKFDKEFKTVLNSEQKSKLNTIRKIQRKDLKNCRKNKRLYKQDKNLRPFGVYETEQTSLCPVHKKWHVFGIKHKK